MLETSSVISLSGGRNLGGASATMQLEALQATLKQQQGTIIQHQMDVAGLERTKEGSQTIRSYISRFSRGSLKNHYTESLKNCPSIL